MSTRERWIVYPLLALALGSSMKSHIVRRFECDTLVASHIKIVDRRSRPQAVLQSTPNGAELVLISADTATQASISSSSVIAQKVQIVGPNGRPQGILTASPNGAMLKLHDQHGQPHTILGEGVLHTNTVRVGVGKPGSVLVVGTDGKPQAVLKATEEGVGWLRLINTNNDASFNQSVPTLVKPANVKSKTPAATKKKPEPKKKREKSAPKR